MFVTKKMPRSLSAEAYRSLRTSIKFSSADKLIKTIVVTSSLIGEGKSTVVGNLAYSLNQDGSRVLVIDCDLRKPSIHENFLLSNEKGLTDILVGKSDLKSVTKKPPFSVVPPAIETLTGAKGNGNLAIPYLCSLETIFKYFSNPGDNS